MPVGPILAGLVAGVFVIAATSWRRERLADRKRPKRGRQALGGK